MPALSTLIRSGIVFITFFSTHFVSPSKDTASDGGSGRRPYRVVDFVDLPRTTDRCEHLTFTFYSQPLPNCPRHSSEGMAGCFRCNMSVEELVCNGRYYTRDELAKKHVYVRHPCHTRFFFLSTLVNRTYDGAVCASVPGKPAPTYKLSGSVSLKHWVPGHRCTYHFTEWTLCGEMRMLSDGATRTLRGESSCQRPLREDLTTGGN